jgi:hypothetical protein
MHVLRLIVCTHDNDQDGSGEIYCDRFPGLNIANAYVRVTMSRPQLFPTFQPALFRKWRCGIFEFQSQRREHFIPYSIHPVPWVPGVYGIPSIRLEHNSHILQGQPVR